MKNIYTIAAVVVAGLLLGCGAKDGEEQGAIPAGPLNTLEKAKGTEKMMQEAEEKRRREMEEQGI
jgi:hypothetical protein